MICQNHPFLDRLCKKRVRNDLNSPKTGEIQFRMIKRVEIIDSKSHWPKKKTVSPYKNLSFIVF